MDVLADVLAVTRMESSTMCSADFSAPWGLEFEPANRATFHIVSRGSCSLLIRHPGESLRMHQGDLVLIPHGRGHRLVDRPDTPIQYHGRYGRTRAQDQFQGTGEASTLFCGAYYYDHEGLNPMLSLLPPVIHLSADRARADDKLQAVVRLLTRESADTAPGFKTVIERLMDVLFVYVVRAWLIEQPENGAGRMVALRDPQISRALRLIHETPQRRWTLDSLAREVSMSRAAFAKRFSALVGESPLRYLRRWRMNLAAQLLREGEGTVGWVANKVGYESETTFSRTFRHSRGIAPGLYRARSVHASG